MSRPLIEDSYKLPVSALKQRQGGSSSLREALNDGYLTISRSQNRMEANYWFEQAEDELYLIIGLMGEPKRIRITITYPYFGGERYFFECPECGRRCEKLYLAPESLDFKCHKHFIYEVSTFNQQSKRGRCLYRGNRVIKLVDKRAKMNRIFYRGELTKPFCQFLKMSARAGLVKEVSEAMSLWKTISASEISLT